MEKLLIILDVITIPLRHPIECFKLLKEAIKAGMNDKEVISLTEEEFKRITNP